METFRKADVLFCMFFLHRMFIKENILLTDSEDKKIKSSELYYREVKQKICATYEFDGIREISRDTYCR